MNRVDNIRKNQIALFAIPAILIILATATSGWAGFTGTISEFPYAAEHAAILPGSMWTPIFSFTVDDADADDPPVEFYSMRVNFIPPPGSPNTFSWEDISAVAIAREPLFPIRDTYSPFNPEEHTIISVSTLPEGSLSTTLFVPQQYQLCADASVDPPYQTHFHILVKTGTDFIDGEIFHPQLNINANVYSPPPIVAWGYDPLSPSFTCVNNIGDLTPNSEGVVDFDPSVGFDESEAWPLEQLFYPPSYPSIAAVHPDGRGVFPLTGGNMPEVWPAGSPNRDVLGIELAGGYPNGVITFSSLALELISNGRKAEWLADRVDNDGDQLLVATNGVDDDEDGLVDELDEGIDEDEARDYQWENRNDDADLFVDNPGPDGIWGPNIEGVNDDPGINGMFDQGVDYIYNDVGEIPEQLDAFDSIPGDDRILAQFDGRPIQKLLVNDDEDFYFDDAATFIPDFHESGEPVGFPEQFDYGIDPVVLDDGIFPGFLDHQDTFLYEGVSGEENFFGGDYISNDDDDYYMIDGIRKNLVGGLTVLEGPESFLPYIDEIYLDTGEVQLQLDAADEMLYEGTNAWPIEFPYLFPDNDVLNFNDDDDYFIDNQDTLDDPEMVGVYDIVFDLVVLDVDDDEVLSASDIIVYPGGSIDDDGVIEVNEAIDATAILELDFLGVVLLPLIDEEPADEGAPPRGANGFDDDGDGERGYFDVANGEDDDGDSVDTDGDGYVDGLEEHFGTDIEDALDFPEDIEPVPDYYFIDEGIDEDTDFTPFGMGRGVEPFNRYGAISDEDPPNGIDDDGDGVIDEDPENTVSTDQPIFALIDEEYEDNIDNDFDGQVDEDIDEIPFQAAVDEEILDYYVDEPTPDVEDPEVILREGVFDFVKTAYGDAPLGLGMEGAFGPRFFPVSDSPSQIILGHMNFELSVEGDVPLDEYYVDFNANGIYDTGQGDGYENRQDECLFAGFDGIPTLRQGDVYGEKARPIDNDGDGEDHDGDPSTPPRPDGIDNDGDGIVDEGFNEDCGDSAFTFEDYEGSGAELAANGFQVYQDTGDGVFNEADTLISNGFSHVFFQPNRAGGILDQHADFPHYSVQIFFDDAYELEQVDDGLFDFFVIMSTDDDDNDFANTASTTKGLSFGDDWSIKLGKFNFNLSEQFFLYAFDMFPNLVNVHNPMPAGIPNNHEHTKAQYGRLYINDTIGFIQDGLVTTAVGAIQYGDSPPEVQPGGLLFAYPFIDSKSSYLPVIGMNIAGAANDSPTADASGGQTSDEKLVSVRVNFVNADLEGEGTFEPTDLMPLAEELGSGVALFIDSVTEGLNSAFDYDIFNDQDEDPYIPLTNPVWDEDPTDPVVLAGGHYVVLRPQQAVQLPLDDVGADSGYDFFVAVRSSDTIDYHDAFRCFIRDGDIRFQNSRNVVNTRRATDPIAANCPTILSDLVKPSFNDQAMIPPLSKPIEVVGLDIHDSNNTFEGQPSKLRTVRVYFDSIDDNDFTPADLAEIYWGPGNELRQWEVFDPDAGFTGIGKSYPYPHSGPGRLVSRNGVALYRDMPNSDTNGGFDDPMDPAVVNPDKPVLLSGLEDWNFLGGFTYNVNLELDPPRWEGTDDPVDTSPVDPDDPDPYESLPPSTDGEYEGDDFFVVIRSSAGIQFGDNFTVGVRTEVGNRLGGTAPITFYPNLSNADNYMDITQPYSEALTFKSITTRDLFAPTVTITSLRNLVDIGAREDATSDRFPIFAINMIDDEFGQETLNGLRVEVRSIDGFNLNDLNAMSGEEDSGLQLYQDNPTAGIPREFDPEDIFIPTFEAVAIDNWFADDPGADGQVGTYDDPGEVGVYDEGIDEIYIDEGVEEAILDFADTLIDDGDNNERDTQPGQTLYPMQREYKVPGIFETQVSIFMRLVNPTSIPADDAGVNFGPDFFIVGQTSTEIDYRDKFAFRMARDGVFFSSGPSFAQADMKSQPVTANVPTFLEDITPQTATTIFDPTAVIGIHVANERPEAVTLRNITIHFASVGDNDFTRTDIATIFPELGPDGELTSGISVWKNTNDNRSFDYDPENPHRNDTFIPLATVPNYFSEGANPYPRFGVTIPLDPNSPDIVLPPKGPIEGANRVPDFFIVIKPSIQAITGDDFTVSIFPGDVVFGQNAKDSGETVETRPVTFGVDRPPEFIFLEPEKSDEPLVVDNHGGVFTVRWSDFDDTNSLLQLFYFNDQGPDTFPPEEMLTPLSNETDPETGEPIPHEPIPVIPDGPEADTFVWDISNVTAEVPLRLLARIEEDNEVRLRVLSGAIVIINEPPTFEFIRPATDELVKEDVYVTEWIDSDPDNSLLFDLYLDPNNDPEVASGRILLATDIPEDPDGEEGDSFEIPVTELLQSGDIIAGVSYYVMAEINDGVARGDVVPATQYVYSDGTITADTLLRIAITRPVVDEEVELSATIEWTERIPPQHDDARIRLYWASPGDVASATPGEQIEGALELPASQLIVAASSSVLDGSYEWDLRASENVPVGEEVFIYAEIEDASGFIRSTVSLGQFEIIAPSGIWPVYVRGPVIASPLVADIVPGGTDNNEVIVITREGLLYAFDSMGFELCEPVQLGLPSESGVPRVESSPALIDLDAEDNRKELIVAISEHALGEVGEPTAALYMIPLYSEDSTCLTVAQENIEELRIPILRPVQSATATNNSLVSTAGIDDIDGDGILEAVIGTGEGDLVAVELQWDDENDRPAMSLQWRLSEGAAGEPLNTIQSSPAIGDVDGDAGMEILVYTDSGDLYVIESASQGQPTATRILEGGTRPEIFAVAAYSASLGDVDGDGVSEAVIGTPSILPQNGKVFILNGEDGSSPVATDEVGAATTIKGQITTAPALADVNGDENLDIIVLTTTAGQSGLAYAFTVNAETGQLVKLFEYALSSPPTSSPVVGDYNPEGNIFFGSYGGRLGSIYWDTEAEVVKKTPEVEEMDPLGSSIEAPAVVVDLEANGKRDVVYVTNGDTNGVNSEPRSVVHKLESEIALLPNAPLEWPTFKHDNNRTGDIASPIGFRGLLDKNGNGKIDFEDLFMISSQWGREQQLYRRPQGSLSTAPETEEIDTDTVIQLMRFWKQSE